VPAPSPPLQHDVEPYRAADDVTELETGFGNCGRERGGAVHYTDAGDIVAHLPPELIPGCERRGEPEPERGRRSDACIAVVEIDRDVDRLARAGARRNGARGAEGALAAQRSADAHARIRRNRLPAAHAIDAADRQRHGGRSLLGAVYRLAHSLVLRRARHDPLGAAVVVAEAHEERLRREPEMIAGVVPARE